MGGKSAPTAPPPVEPQSSFDPTMMMQMMQAMMGTLGEMRAPEIPAVPEAPPVEKEKAIDWTEKNKELAAKAKADYAISERSKKGRTDTILTSPLLDEELSKESLLTGG